MMNIPSLLSLALVVLTAGSCQTRTRKAAASAPAATPAPAVDAPQTAASEAADTLSASGSQYLLCRRTDGGDEGLLLRRTAYVTAYDAQRLTPMWVGWTLTAAHTDGPHERKGHKFYEDTDVPEPRALYSDIRESECGYQRGHMCPAADNKWSRQAQDESFLMTNICPQNGDLNGRDWKALEDACRTWATRWGTVHIVCGPIYRRKRPHRVGAHRIAVPDAFFKVVLTGSGSDARCIGFVYDNVAGHKPMASYACSVDDVEERTGLDFFSALPDDVEAAIEVRCDVDQWPV